LIWAGTLEHRCRAGAEDLGRCRDLREGASYGISFPGVEMGPGLAHGQIGGLLAGLRRHQFRGFEEVFEPAEVLIGRAEGREDVEGLSRIRSRFPDWHGAPRMADAHTPQLAHMGVSCFDAAD
jgi:hypothetical protein